MELFRGDEISSERQYNAVFNSGGFNKRDV